MRPSPFLPTPSRIDFALVNKSLEIHLQKAVISKQQAGATEPGQRDYVRIVGLANPRILNSFSLCIHPGIVEIYSSSGQYRRLKPILEIYLSAKFTSQLATHNQLAAPS